MSVRKSPIYRVPDMTDHTANPEELQAQIDRLVGAKDSLKTSIANKGVTVPDSVKMDGLAALVDSIDTGIKNFAITATMTSLTDATITVDKTLAEIEAAYQAEKNLSCRLVIPGSTGGWLKLPNIERFTSDGRYLFSGMGIVYFAANTPSYVLIYLMISSSGPVFNFKEIPDLTNANGVSF